MQAPFAAIDFETADTPRDSACALGVVIVEGGRIIWSAARLIRPPRRRFTFSHIHGLTWKDVASAPGFETVWREVSDRIAGVAFLAAHNAAFDRSVLNASCAAAGLAPPQKEFVCTLALARRAWRLRPARLPDVCRHLGIPLQHHNALSDAEACAQIVLAGLRSGFPLPDNVAGKRHAGQGLHS